MKALTIKEPWATLIVRAGKDIENRDWHTNYRGFLLIHSSARMAEADMQDACDLMQGFIPKFSSARFRQESFHPGAILGAVEVVDCVKQSDSPWFFGEFGFVLRDAVAFANPIRCKGSLGLWNVPNDVLALARQEYRMAAKERLVG